MRLSRNCFKVVINTLVVGSVMLTANTFVFADETALSPQNDHFISSASGIVAADHPIASKLGAQILAQGGNAADASVTTMLALGVVNPFASGLGGGGFCLYRDAETTSVDVLDFREIAPLSGYREMFMVDGEDHAKLARHSGLAVGVPGEAAGLWALHGRHGKLPWEKVVEPTVSLAKDGFPVGETLARHVSNMTDTIDAQSPLLASLLQTPEGKWVELGDHIAFPNLAKALTLLQNKGVAPFYSGDVADAIVNAVQNANGIMTKEDLLNYRVESRKPVSGTYRGYEIISMPPPSSGGIAIIQALNILENADLNNMGWNDSAIHLIAEALKHAFADRAHWLGDDDFVDVPIEQLLSKEYARTLFERIDPDAVLELQEYGTTMPDEDLPGTSHLSIIDQEGNMAACTTTVNTRFGSMVVVPEFDLVLNNEMADFNTRPGQPNIFGLVTNERNIVEPRKRPLSSMSPTLVLKDGQPFISVGASGGPTIITSTLMAIVRIIDYRHNALDAIAMPRLHHQWIPNRLWLEPKEDPQWIEQLQRRGHEIMQRPAFSATQIVIRKNAAIMSGASDPRKGGHPAAAE